MAGERDGGALDGLAVLVGDDAGRDEVVLVGQARRREGQRGLRGGAEFERELGGGGLLAVIAGVGGAHALRAGAAGPGAGEQEGAPVRALPRGRSSPPGGPADSWIGSSAGWPSTSAVAVIREPPGASSAVSLSATCARAGSVVAVNGSARSRRPAPPN